MEKKIYEIIIESLEELNEELENKIEITKDIIFIGNDGVMDSLDFVNFIIIIEEKILEEFDKEITIVDEKAFSRKRSPFRNIESLIEYLIEILEI